MEVRKRRRFFPRVEPLFGIDASARARVERLANVARPVAALVSRVARNAVLEKRLNQAVARKAEFLFVDSEHVQMPRAPASAVDSLRIDAGNIAQQGRQIERVFVANVRLRGDMRKLRRENRALEPRHAVVGGAHGPVFVERSSRMRQEPVRVRVEDFVREELVVGQNDAPFASAEVLADLHTETSERTERSEFSPFPLAHDRLTGVLDYRNIAFLAEFENNIPETVDWESLKKKYVPATQSMGFLSSGDSSAYGYQITPGTTPRRILGEANLQDVQFAMLVGEVLTIKYGKVRSGIDINAPYSLEPYQLKEIEGRWYVIGNLYPLGHKESAEIAIYDLGRLQFAEEENPDVLYEPVKGFDINNEETLEEICRRTGKPFEGWYFNRIGKVYTIDIRAHTEEFAKYISDHPLCSAQEDFSDGRFRIYSRLTTDLFFMFGAYGAELSFDVIPKNDDPSEAEIIKQQLNYFRNTGDE